VSPDFVWYLKTFRSVRKKRVQSWPLPVSHQLVTRPQPKAKGDWGLEIGKLRHKQQQGPAAIPQ
jgi:hypothetical protein